MDVWTLRQRMMLDRVIHEGWILNSRTMMHAVTEGIMQYVRTPAHATQYSSVSGSDSGGEVTGNHHLPRHLCWLPLQWPTSSQKLPLTYFRPNKNSFLGGRHIYGVSDKREHTVRPFERYRYIVLRHTSSPSWGSNWYWITAFNTGFSCRKHWMLYSRDIYRNKQQLAHY